MRRAHKLLESVAERIAHRLNPAIETAVDPKYRFRTKFEIFSFFDLVRIASVPVGICFVLNAVPFLRGTDESSFYGWRVLSHLGPYHVPHVVNGGRWRHALSQLSRSEELGLIESEISQILTDIEVVTQRRVAVRRIVAEEGFGIFVPVLKNLASSSQKGQSHFEANLRVVMDVVSATPAKDRALPVDVLEALVTTNLACWESDTSEDGRRFREYRAVLLLKLLQNESNLFNAKKSQIITSFVTSEEQAAAHQVYPTLPLMPLLYQFKTENLGFEFSDIIQRLKKMMDLPVAELEERKSLRLEYKIDFVNFEKLAYLTICYASLRVVPMISEYSFSVLSRAGTVIGRSVLGAGLAELVYRAEEHVIQSAPWYDSGIAASACMAAVNVVTAATILRFFPFCGLPWLLIRVRDSFSDSFRFL